MHKETSTSHKTQSLVYFSHTSQDGQAGFSLHYIPPPHFQARHLRFRLQGLDGAEDGIVREDSLLGQGQAAVTMHTFLKQANEGCTLARRLPVGVGNGKVHEREFRLAILSLLVNGSLCLPS